jgi:hypothetical protein
MVKIYNICDTIYLTPCLSIYYDNLEFNIELSWIKWTISVKLKNLI